MKLWDFYAVTLQDDPSVYCNECADVDLNGENVYPIFADQEWDHYPVCDVCGREHDYVRLTSEGIRRLEEDADA